MNVQEFQNTLIGICKTLNVKDLSMVEISIPEVKIFAVTDSGEVNFQMNNLKLTMQDDDNKGSEKEKKSDKNVLQKTPEILKEDTDDTPESNSNTMMRFLSDDEVKAILSKESPINKINLEKGVANLRQVLLTKYSICTVTGPQLSKVFNISSSAISHAASNLRASMIKYIVTNHKDAIVSSKIVLEPIKNNLIRFYKNEFSSKELYKFINRCNLDIASGRVKI